ncbi:unnamed protein product [Peniophora sp. CBMAI 1063]|nr:unnamed protein product [Peniophora sp. CBMAI 1063]
MEYRFGKLANGQYVDGHERDDVVEYRQHSYLPRLWELESGLRQYDSATGREVSPDGTGSSIPWPPRRVVLWFHDESTFYANDRRWVGWAGPDAKATPRAKGEGQSLMVSDFFSPDYGWLRRRTTYPGDERKQDARVLFKAGKNRDGWFTNVTFVAQLEDAMTILAEDYPFEKHVFIVDNATIHAKRSETAPSARNMTKKPSRNVLANVTAIGEDGLPLLDSNGKAIKRKAKMSDARLHDGTPQPLYFPDDASICPKGYCKKAGQFKGMTRILEERGYTHAGKLRHQCDNFKCPESFDRSNPCCQRRLMYNEPDFVEVESLAEARASARGFELLFLPKFHCELNPIEQCWCMAKEWYRRQPPSDKEADLERNVLESLVRIPLESMRRFFNRSWRFGCAYKVLSAPFLTNSGDIVAIELPKFSLKRANQLLSVWSSNLQSCGVRERSTNRAALPPSKSKGVRILFERVLKYLWDDVVWPILQAIDVTSPSVDTDCLPHITWCVTGPLAQLPLHAAGNYSSDAGPRIYNYAVSSYTPSLSAHVRACRSQKRRSHAMPQNALIITQPATPGFAPIQKTAVEGARVHEILSEVGVECTALDGTDATVSSVKSSMDHSPWVHIACHGFQHRFDPTLSGFALQDGILTLNMLMSVMADDAELAFLSACQTATGDEKLSDESAHLAAGMIAAGFRGVVATMWSIQDADAPVVVEAYYRRLIELRKAGVVQEYETGAAYALHEAVKKLRESKSVGEGAFIRWVPFVHFGV